LRGEPQAHALDAHSSQEERRGHRIRKWRQVVGWKTNGVDYLNAAVTMNGSPRHRAVTEPKAKD
jgi:hypothetical protein